MGEKAGTALMPIRELTDHENGVIMFCRQSLHRSVPKVAGKDVREKCGNCDIWSNFTKEKE